jgi:hypothetical protein
LESPDSSWQNTFAEGTWNLLTPQASLFDQPSVLEIQVLDRQCVLLDKFATRLNDITHQFGEDVIGFGEIVNFDLQQHPFFWIKRGFPELFRVHFAQTFVALQ